MEMIGERIQLRDFTESDRTFFGELEGRPIESLRMPMLITSALRT
jgi:hypothetical protein